MYHIYAYILYTYTIRVLYHCIYCIDYIYYYYVDGIYEHTYKAKYNRFAQNLLWSAT